MQQILFQSALPLPEESISSFKRISVKWLRDKYAIKTKTNA